MARLNREELDHCINEQLCLDCHQNEEATPAERIQKRRKYTVPCCSHHYNLHADKLRLQDAKKYQRNVVRKQALGQCVSKGCRNYRIPEGILPPGQPEKNCGFHSKGKEPCRTTIARLILERCYTPQDRDGMVPQSIQFSKNYGLIFFTARVKNDYVTEVFTMRSLLDLHAKLTA